MIKVEKLSYSFPTKDLYNKVSFSIEENQHAVLIGSNGTGKSTLIQMLMNPDDFLYQGKIKRRIDGRIGYVSQFEKAEKLLTIQTLTDSDRELEATQGERFVVYKTDSVIYAARLEVAALSYGVTEEYLQDRFHLIHMDWKSGVT